MKSSLHEIFHSFDCPIWAAQYLTLLKCFTCFYRLSARIDGRYVYGILPLDIHGDIDLAANGIQYSITSAIDAENGTAKTETLDCVARVHQMDMNIRNGGLVGGLINLFKVRKCFKFCSC